MNAAQLEQAKWDPTVAGLAVGARVRVARVFASMPQYNVTIIGTVEFNDPAERFLYVRPIGGDRRLMVSKRRADRERDVVTILDDTTAAVSS